MHVTALALSTVQFNNFRTNYIFVMVFSHTDL